MVDLVDATDSKSVIERCASSSLARGTIPCISSVLVAPLRCAAPAGGHLALMGGLLANDNRFDTNCSGVENIKVAAIIDKYGIVDVGEKRYGKFRSGSEKKWLGDKVNDLAFIASVSPIEVVKKDSPPIFIVHGDSDPTVPIQQSIDLKKKLDELGVKSEFMVIPGGLHGKFTPAQNAEVDAAIMKFILSLKEFK